MNVSPLAHPPQSIHGDTTAGTRVAPQPWQLVWNHDTGPGTTFATREAAFAAAAEASAGDAPMHVVQAQRDRASIIGYTVHPASATITRWGGGVVASSAITDAVEAALAMGNRVGAFGPDVPRNGFVGVVDGARRLELTVLHDRTYPSYSRPWGVRRLVASTSS